MMPTVLNNRYRILQNLGAGGFGNTFLAEDTYMPSGRRCVIKQLKPITNNPQTYKLVQDRFQREAAVLEDLGEGSNQIPKLYAYFTEAGQFYLVQEYIEGDTLTKQLEQRGRFSENEVRQILVSLLPVLDYVHSRRIVHRDIKPDNIIIRKRDGLPVLIDFGAVKEAMNTAVNDPANSAPSMVIGTPGFMSPEQAGGRPTYSSDLYSLALTAIYLLTGKLPEELQTDNRTGEILWRQYAPNINPNLAMVIDRAIRFNVRDRFATAPDMLNALQSAGAPTDMATVAVAPANYPHSPNGATPSVATPSPPQTVPGGAPPVIRPKQRNPFVIVGLIAGGILLAVIAISMGLRRDRTSPVSSSSVPTSEQPSTTQPSTLPVPSSRSQPTNSDPTAEQPSTSSRSRSQPADSEPTSGQSTTGQSSSSTSSRSRPKPADVTPSPVLPDSPSSPSTQAPSSRNSSPNSTVPTNIPGFAPGAQATYVKGELGNPTKTSTGVWPNTRALLYEDFVPGQVSLGYLFDRNTGRLRQSEASFSPSVALNTMSGTLDEMLNNNTPADIRQGLESVYQGKSRHYKFVTGRDGSLKGVIERNERDRIYMAVWEADLH